MFLLWTVAVTRPASLTLARHTEISPEWQGRVGGLRDVSETRYRHFNPRLLIEINDAAFLFNRSYFASRLVSVNHNLFVNGCGGARRTVISSGVGPPIGCLIKQSIFSRAPRRTNEEQCQTQNAEKKFD